MGQTSPRPPRHVFSRDVTPQCYSSGYMLLDVMGGCQAVAVTLEQPIKCPRLAVRSTATPIMCLCVSVTVCWTLPHYAYCLRELQCLQVSIKVLRRLQSKLKCIHPTISLLCLCHFCLRIVIIIIISCTCIITYIIIVMCRKLTFPPLCLYSCCQDPVDTSSFPVLVYFVLRDCFRPELQSTVQVQIKGLFTEVPLHIQLQQ